MAYLAAAAGVVGGVMLVSRTNIGSVLAKTPTGAMGPASSMQVIGADAPDTYADDLAQAGEDPDALTSLGDRMMKLHRPDHGVDAYTRVIEGGRETADMYIRRGRALVAVGKAVDARKDFNAALKLDPNAGAAVSGVGESWLVEDRSDRAMACFDVALQRDPADVRALIGRGRVLQERGDEQEAIDAFSQAVEQDEAAVEAYVGRSRARLASGDPAGAMDDAHKAAETDELDAPAWRWYATLLVKQGRNQAALAAAEHALALNPDDPVALSARAFSRAALGDLDNARADALAALKAGAAKMPSRAALERLVAADPRDP